MTADPPPQLYQLGLAADKFKRADSKSWRGPCPRCGGERRLLVFTDHPFPKWHCVCDNCGMKAWADQLNHALRQPVSDEQRSEWARQQAAEQERREAYRRERLAEFSNADLLAELHRRLTDEHRRQWEAWGVPADWQDYLQIGFHPHKTYIGQDGATHHSPAFTIPYFHLGFEFKTLQYRLSDPALSDRYRFTHGLGTAYYMTTPSDPIGDQVLICEGAKKAMVAAVYRPDGLTVLAVPSKSDFGGVVEAVRDCERVTVLLDPDADLQAWKLCKAIGPAARQAVLPHKLDDVLVADRAGAPRRLALALKWARPM